MKNITLRDGYEPFVEVNVLLAHKNGRGRFCPNCYTANPVITDRKTCDSCSESLLADEEAIRELLSRNGLEKYIPLFEEQGLLNAGVLSNMKDEDWEKIGISAVGDKKLLGKLFTTQKKDRTLMGCSIIILVVVLVMFLIVKFLGFSTLTSLKITAGFFILLPIAWLLN